MACECKVFLIRRIEFKDMLTCEVDGSLALLYENAGEAAGEPWGEGARRRASIWFYPLGFRISAPWAHILIYHSDRLLRGGPSVRFLKASGIINTPLIEEALCVRESLRGATITTYRKNEPRRTPVLTCQGLMYQSTYAAYKRFMKTITIAAIGFFRYFKGGDIFIGIHNSLQMEEV